jgi:hypothetical protein
LGARIAEQMLKLKMMILREKPGAETAVNG